MGDVAGLIGMKRRAFALQVPLSAHLELTYACNWRCVFCFNPRHQDVRRLTLEEWQALLADLRELGTMFLTLTGGEPLANPDFFPIAEAARARGFALRIFTNASLVTEVSAARIAALDPQAVEVSLHGATGEVHDRATARPGSFDEMWRGVSLLRSAAVPVVVKVPLTRLNEHQLDAMIALVDEADLPLRIDPTITMRDDGDRSPLDYAASPDGVRRLFERLRAAGKLPESHRNPGDANCGVGRTSVAIDPEGNVYPCAQWRHTALGNVRKARLMDLWRGSPVRQQAMGAAMEANAALVERGGTAASWSFCPALAHQETGDTAAPYAGFTALSELAASVRSRVTDEDVHDDRPGRLE